MSIPQPQPLQVGTPTSPRPIKANPETRKNAHVKISLPTFQGSVHMLVVLRVVQQH
jgi:hypothetical protein